MPKPQTTAVLFRVRQIEGVLTVGTAGTRAGAGQQKVLVAWSLHWGDGSTDAGPNAPPDNLVHTFAASGVYLQQLTVTDSKGGVAVASLTSSITVMPPTPLPEPPPPGPIPSPPTGLNATAGDTQVTLGWTASSGATSYNVKRSISSGGPYATIASVLTPTYVNTGLTNGTPYYFVVSARNANGESANTSQVSATPTPALPPPPATPTNVQAVAGVGQITISWTASDGATSYRVQRSLSSGSGYSTLALPTGTSHVDSTVAPGTVYYYKVSAINAGGESAASVPVSAAAPTAPEVPTGLVATAGDGQASLQWNPVSSATSYRVKRATVSGGPYTLAGTPGVTNFTDTGLTNLVTYYYVVSAVNEFGESANSSQVSVVPSVSPPVVSDSGNYRPQFYGFGTNTPGGRGGTIYRVNTLADDNNAPVLQGDGTYTSSFRAAVLATGARVVVFEVSGYINLTSLLWIVQPYLTVAGQTAPSPGITVRSVGTFGADRGMYVGTHDVVLQHFRIRPGDTTCNSGIQTYDGGSGLGVHHNVFDHLSISWFQDEGFNFTDQSNNQTLWRSIVAEALSAVPGSGACSGGGSAWNGIGVGTGDYNSILQNLIAHNGTRNPQIDGGTIGALQNNLIYEPWDGPLWRSFSASAWFWRADGNYLRRGTQNTSGGGGGSFTAVDAPSGSQLYLNDNIEDNSGTPADFRGFAFFGGIDPRVGAPPTEAIVPGYTALSASATYAHVLAHAGARPLDRDSVDTRIVLDVQNRTGLLGFDQVSDVGGYPTLPNNSSPFTLPANPHSIAEGQAFRTNLEMALEAQAVALEP